MRVYKYSVNKSDEMGQGKNDCLSKAKRGSELKKGIA
jgi:hypothetical protein